LKETFDLIALRTSSLDIFHAACQSYAIDIISLHCNERLAFELNLHDIKNAMNKNVYFELCYAPSIRGKIQSLKLLLSKNTNSIYQDNQARTYTMQLAKQLFQYTKGQQMIISSEAEIVSEIRNPADIFYL
jgi:RNase P/RNase MRP subunit p30